MLACFALQCAPTKHYRLSNLSVLPCPTVLAGVFVRFKEALCPEFFAA
jgi:hypothetical protein